MFTFMLILSAGMLCVAIALALGALFARSYDGFGYGVGAIVMLIVALVIGLATLSIWENHAANLGTIEAQHEVIAVYQQRIARLTERLESFNYRREDAQILLNADSPVAAVVTSLTQAEGQLAEAEAQKAVAMRSIEQRRRGPWKGVISYAGDYK